MRSLADISTLVPVTDLVHSAVPHAGEGIPGQHVGVTDGDTIANRTAAAEIVSDPTSGSWKGNRGDARSTTINDGSPGRLTGPSDCALPYFRRHLATSGDAPDWIWNHFGSAVVNATVALEATHLCKKYENSPAVNDLSFQVGAGEVYGLVGPNGAGKSTTMMMIIGQLPPDSGSIRLQGKPFDPGDRRMRASLGFAPQDIALYPALSAVQNLRFFGRLYGLRGQQLRQRVDRILELTGLRETADHRLSTYSGGMKRRLNFGVALPISQNSSCWTNPPLELIRNREPICWKECATWAREGVAVLYATHYMEEVEEVLPPRGHHRPWHAVTAGNTRRVAWQGRG